MSPSQELHIKTLEAPIYREQTQEALERMTQGPRWAMDGKQSGWQQARPTSIDPLGISFKVRVAGARDHTADVSLAADGAHMLGLEGERVTRLLLQDLPDDAMVPASRAFGLLSSDVRLIASMLKASPGLEIPRRGWRVVCLPRVIYLFANHKIFSNGPTSERQIQPLADSNIRMILRSETTNHAKMATRAQANTRFMALLTDHDTHAS